MAGDMAAAAQRQAQSSVGYYNLLWGPVALRSSASMSAEFNDNVRNSAHAESDEILRPAANLQLTWPVTEWNTLNLVVDTGYSFYTQHDDLSQFFLNPGSGLSFDIYIKDWKFNLHDRATVTEYTYENPANSGGQNNTFLQNDAGVTGFWDLNQAVLNVGFEHENYLGLQTMRGQPDSTSENFFLNTGVRVRPEIMVGLESGLGLVHYDSEKTANAILTSDAVQWNAGAFASVQISPHLSLRVDGGYTVYSPENTRTNTASEMSALYFQFSISHAVTEHISYSLSAGHSVDFSYNGQPYDRYFVRLDPSWNIVRKISIGTPVWWEQSKQLGLGGSNYDQYGAGVSLGRALTQKLSASIYYRLVVETSDRAEYNYTANIAGLNLSYQF